MENRGMSKNGTFPIFFMRATLRKKKNFFYLRAIVQMIFSMFLMAEKIENFVFS